MLKAERKKHALGVDAKKNQYQQSEGGEEVVHPLRMLKVRLRLCFLSIIATRHAYWRGKRVDIQHDHCLVFFHEIRHPKGTTSNESCHCFFARPQNQSSNLSKRASAGRQPARQRNELCGLRIHSSSKVVLKVVLLVSMSCIFCVHQFQCFDFPLGLLNNDNPNRCLTR